MVLIAVAVIICVLNEMKKKKSVFWVLELFYFPRVYLEVKLLKIPRYQILPLKEEKLILGGGIIGT